MCHCISINKMFSDMNKDFEIMFLLRKNLVRYGNSFRSILKEIILLFSVS